MASWNMRKRFLGSGDGNRALRRRAYEQVMKARPTSNATIEAVKQAVRGRGLPALDEIETRERLQRCDAAAIAEIDHWLLKRGISR
jgi:hypothetical protein